MKKQRRSVFFDEWRDCLHSHFLHVVENNDTITEPTLRQVLQDAGVSHDKIEEWYREAMIRRGDGDLLNVAEAALIDKLEADEAFMEKIELDDDLDAVPDESLDEYEPVADETLLAEHEPLIEDESEHEDTSDDSTDADLVAEDSNELDEPDAQDSTDDMDVSPPDISDDVPDEPNDPDDTPPDDPQATSSQLGLFDF